MLLSSCYRIQSLPDSVPASRPQRRMRSAVAYVIEALERRLLLATAATLVSDIVPGAGSSGPFNLTSFNGRLFFVASRPDVGMELWKSDGTETELPAVGQPLPEKPSGTSLVKDINPGAGNSNPSQLTELVLRYGGNKVKDVLFFTANDGQHGTDLWMTDGTRDGTQIVTGQPNNLYPSDLTPVSETGTLYFSADDGINGRELWKTVTAADGSVSVAMVKDLYPGSDVLPDGTVVPHSSDPGSLTDLKGTLFFSAYVPANGRELCKSDGTADGTTVVADIYPGGDILPDGTFVPHSSDPQYLTNVNGTLFFSAVDGEHGRELWKSDGTLDGTALVKDIYPGGDVLPDGTVAPYSSNPQDLTSVGGTLYFAAYRKDIGMELWKSDGTDAGTVLVKDINEGVLAPGLGASSYPTELTDVHDTLYFAAADGTDGQELWVSDGTDAGTHMVKDLFPGNDAMGNPNSSMPTKLTACGDSLFFIARDATHPRAVYKLLKKGDGSLDIELVGGPNPAYSFAGQDMAIVDGTLYFAGIDDAHGLELWKAAPPQPKPDPNTGERPTVPGPTIAQAPGLAPPDANGAVGPDYLVATVNRSIQISTKTGAGPQTMSLNNFFVSLHPAHDLFDPKAIYDQYSCSFVVIALEEDDASKTSRILVAQSFDSDPTNPDAPADFNARWSFLAIDGRDQKTLPDHWSDFPGLGVDKQAIYITSKMYSFVGKTFGGSRLWIIDKSKAFAAAAVNGPLDPSAGANLRDPSSNLAKQPSSLQPAHMYGTAASGLGTFLVSTGWEDAAHSLTPWTNAAGDDLLSVIRVDNPVSGPTFTNQFISLGHLVASLSLPDAEQSGPGHPPKVNTNNGRALSAVWRNNSLWVSSTIDPLSDNGQPVGRATAHWCQIDTSDLDALTRSGQGNVTGADLGVGTATYFPSVMVDSAGDMGIGFAASGAFFSGVHPGGYYAGRRPGDLAGTVRATHPLKVGDDIYDLVRNGRNRWGDYSGIALDPSATSDMWVFNEYALQRDANGNGGWGTMWRSLSFANPGGTPGLIAGRLFNDPTDNGTLLAGDAPLAGWTVYLDTNGNGVLDPGETSTVTDADGNYSFSGLPAGSYTVRIVTPPGWAQTSSSAYQVQLQDADSAPERDFGAVQTGSITGTVFNDANHNGTRDAGEAGLGGVTVYLDADNNGVFDPGEISTETDAVGNYKFDSLIPGDYIVREVVPVGYGVTAPLTYSATVTVSSAQTSAGPVFGDVGVSTVRMDFGYFVTLARNYGQAGTFATGDLNGDGKVDFSDLIMLARRYGSTLAGSAGATFAAADPLSSARLVTSGHRRHRRPMPAAEVAVVLQLPPQGTGEIAGSA